MDVIKTYIPKRYRNKKLVNTGSGSGSTTVINSGNDISPSSFVDSDTFYSMFELVDLSGTPAIKAKHEFFSVAGVTAYGTGTVATGGSGSSVSVLDVLNSTDTGSALSANMGRVLNEGKLNRSEISSWALGANKPTYGISEITGLSASLSGKSAVGHKHYISEIYDFAHVHQWGDIQNKPSVFTPDVHDHYVADILNFPTSMPASDVYAWAKASTKPSYIASEIGGLGANYRWLTDAYIATWNLAHTNNHTHTNKTIIDQLSQSNLDVLSKLSLVNDKLQISVDTYSTGDLSAYGKSTAILADANVVETTGSSTTSVMSQKSVTDALNLKADLGGSTKTLQQIDDSKVNVVSGNNLIDKSKAYKGYYLNTAGYDLIDNDDYGISVPIPVNGNLTANMAPPAGMCNVVMDADKNILRRFTTEQYTYQLGDVYVRYSFNQASSFMVNVGDTALPYEEYTDKYDVVSRLNILEGLTPIEFDIDELEIVNSTTNGGISRKYGIDAPISSDGSNSYTQIKLKNKDIRGNFIVYADILHTGGMTFMTEFGQTYEIIGSGIIRIGKTFTTSDIINIIAFPNNLGDNTTIQRVLRVSRLYILPMDYASYKSIEPFIINYSERKIYEVSPDFDSTTENYGKYRFTSPVSCFDYFENIRVTNPYCFNEKNKIVVRVMPSIYDEFETKWAGINGETEETYLGICLRSCETWESFDIDSPELTVLKWDGYSGFSATMTTTQAMRRCVFHITDAYTQKKINGFKIIAKNTRYCIHPESAGNGFDASWKIENCLLDWGGRPNVDNEGGCHIGIGISAGETGLIDKVKCIGSGSSKGIGGHNNGFSSGNFPYRPFILNGAKLTITNTNVGGGDIRFQSTTNVSDNYDILKLENVMNVNTAEFYESTGVDANWRAQVVGCDIFTNNLDL